jgi:ketosteroid isomerase-like protein
MKTCPNCHTQYTDDSLKFCLQDGTPLDAARVTEQPTVSLAGQEFETVARANVEGPDSEITQFKQKQSSSTTNISSHPPESASGSKTFLVVAATAAAMLLLFGVLGVGAWLYFRSSGDVAKNTKANQNASVLPNINSNAKAKATVTPTASPTVVSNKNATTPAPTPQIDKQQASREITKQIDDWKSLAESGDLDVYMSKYAETVDYYRKSRTSTDFVRKDKQRAFTMFDSISFTVSNVDISVDDSGERATAAFDKEWVFEGERRSTGKVRQQLQFRKVNGQWLITGERDVKVYYTN